MIHAPWAWSVFFLCNIGWQELASKHYSLPQCAGYNLGLQKPPCFCVIDSNCRRWDRGGYIGRIPTSPGYGVKEAWWLKYVLWISRHFLSLCVWWLDRLPLSVHQLWGGSHLLTNVQSPWWAVVGGNINWPQLCTCFKVRKPWHPDW